MDGRGFHIKENLKMMKKCHEKNSNQQIRVFSI